MKKLKYFIALCFCVSVLSSCQKDECNSTVDIYTYEPVYMTADEINNETITSEATFPLKNPGKIYYFDNLFLK